MSDWESHTVIGQKARAGGSGPRANVARTQGQINAARRQGLVLSVDKKYGTANTKGDAEGQRLTKVDRETDIVKPKSWMPMLVRPLPVLEPKRRCLKRTWPPRSTRSQQLLTTTRPAEPSLTNKCSVRWKELSVSS